MCSYHGLMVAVGFVYNLFGLFWLELFSWLKWLLNWNTWNFFLALKMKLGIQFFPVLFLSLCKQGILIQMKEKRVLAHGTCH